MIKITRSMILFFIFLFLGSNLSALTFMIDTRETLEFDKLEGDRRIRVIATETAIMDALFDNGHIFFSMYTWLDGTNDEIRDLLPIHHSRREAVDYLIRLSPDDEGVAWSLYSVKPAAAVSSGRMELDDTDTFPEDGSVTRWTALGELLAGQILGNIPFN